MLAYPAIQTTAFLYLRMIANNTIISPSTLCGQIHITTIHHTYSTVCIIPFN